MTRGAVALVGLIVAGCASPYPTDWRRDAATDADLRIDAARCRNEARAGSAPMAGIQGLAMAEAIYRDCMIGKGWSRP